jgi:hypothetical protein
MPGSVAEADAALKKKHAKDSTDLIDFTNAHAEVQ